MKRLMIMIGIAATAVLMSTGVFAQEAAKTADSAKAPEKADTKALDAEALKQLQVEKIQQYYLSAGDFSVTFEQRYHSRLTKRMKKSLGKIDFAQPMKMRWQYTEPDNKAFITNGNSLWMVDWEQKQVREHKSLKSSELEAALGFLWGGERISDRYNITELKMKNVEGVSEVGERILFELVPKDTSQFELLYILVDPKSFRITETIVVDTIGNFNQLIFTDAKTKQTFPKDHFTFTTPSKDWDVVPMDF